MKFYLVVSILGVIMVTVGAMPRLPNEGPPYPDIIFDQAKADSRKPIPSRVERDLGFEEVGNEAAYGLDTFRHMESDRKGGDAIGDVRVFRSPDGTIAWKELIV